MAGSRHRSIEKSLHSSLWENSIARETYRAVSQIVSPVALDCQVTFVWPVMLNHVQILWVSAYTRNMYRAHVNRFLTYFLLLITFFMIACNRPPAGLEAFKMSQTAAMALDHFNIELARKTEMGDFKNIQAIDCLASYFYDHDISDLSPK